MKKIFLCLMAILCLMLPAAASAAKKAELESITVTRADTESADAVERISIYETTKGKYLLLPGGWDTSALRVWCGKEKLTLNGQTVKSGDTVSCLTPDSQVELWLGRKKYTLKVMQAAGTGSVFFTTASGKLKYIEGKRYNEETGSVVVNDETGAKLCEQPLTQVRCHGNSSFYKFAKKSYQFKLEKKKNLFGMGKSKTWLLIGSYRDHSFLRNKITSDMATFAGMSYAPEMVHVSLYVNGEYRGLYILSEKVQVGSNRVDIDDLEKMTEALNDKPLSEYPAVGPKQAIGTKPGVSRYYDIPNSPADITGGYLFEVEWYAVPFARGGTAYRTLHNMYVYFKTPKYASKVELDYIKTLIQTMENGIFAKDGIDPDTGKHYSEVLDVESLVLKLTLEEVVKNYDGNRTSQYFYKPSDEVSTRIHTGPVWDYDSSYGCFCLAKYPDTHKPDGLSVTMGKSIGDGERRLWYPALYRHQQIKDAVKQAYVEHYRPAIGILLGETEDPAGTLLSLDAYAAPIAVSAEMDLIRWPYKTIDPNVAFSGRDLNSSVEFLKNWLTQRRDFLDQKWELTESEKAGK